MLENISKEKSLMSEESENLMQTEWKESSEEGQNRCKAENIKRGTLLEFQGEGYRILHRLLNSLENMYDLDPTVADELLRETYNTVIVDFLEVIEIYGYNKIKSNHFEKNIPL